MLQNYISCHSVGSKSMNFKNHFYATFYGYGKIFKKDMKYIFQNRLPVNNHDCHIYCQSIQFTKQLFTLKWLRVYMILITLFIYSYI